MVWPVAPIARSPVNLVDMSVGMVPFSWYALSPLFDSYCDVDSVADETIGLVEGTGCQHGQRAGY